MHEYNTDRSPLILREYGRNFKKLVELICDIESKEERTKKSAGLIKVMKSVNPKVNGLPEDSRKLWDDLFIISNFKLDIDAPYPMPEKDLMKKKVSRLPYRQDPVKYKHYGRNIELLLQEIAKEKDKEVQKTNLLNAIRIIKTLNTNWNKDGRDIYGIVEDIKTILPKDIDINFKELTDQALEAEASYRNANRSRMQQNYMAPKTNTRWTNS